MRYSHYLTNLIPLATVLIGATIFFYPLQLFVQKSIQPLQKSGATIPIESGWIKFQNSSLPTIKFKAGTMGGQAVRGLGNSLQQLSNYILPAGVMLVMLISIFLNLGWVLKELIEKRYPSLSKDAQYCGE